MDTEWLRTWWAQLILILVAMGIGTGAGVLIIRGIDKILHRRSWKK